MNSVCLIGRLTRDPELRYANSGVAICNFSLAVDRRFKSDGQPEVDFINVVTFGKTAEFAIKWFSKGLRVGAMGRIQTRNWEGDDGKRHYATDVIAESLDFADGKRDNNEQKQQTNSDDLDFNDDDCPF